MRIAHYIPFVRLPLGGVVRSVLDFCAELARAGEDVTLLASDDSDVPPSWREPGARLPHFVHLDPPGLPGPVYAPWQHRMITRALRGFDTLHLHVPWEPTNPTVARCARAIGLPYVLSAHGNLDDWCMTKSLRKKMIFHRLFGDRMMREAEAIHCTAQFELDQSCKYFDRAKGVVIPLLMDLTPFRTLPGPQRACRELGMTPGERPLVLFLSRIHEKKGLDLLLDAVAALGKRGIDVDLVVAGTGEADYERHMRRHAERLSLGQRAKFVGMITGDSKVSLFEAADLTVIPTSQENFGFVFLESLAAGTPVLTTRGVDIWPELEESGGATIIDRDPEQLVTSMARLLADRPALRSAGARGREWTLRTMDSARTVERFRSMYKHAAESARPASNRSDRTTGGRRSAAS